MAIGGGSRSVFHYAPRGASCPSFNPGLPDAVPDGAACSRTRAADFAPRDAWRGGGRFENAHVTK
jgi:hypothetical protein